MPSPSLVPQTMPSPSLVLQTMPSPDGALHVPWQLAPPQLDPQTTFWDAALVVHGCHVPAPSQFAAQTTPHSTLAPAGTVAAPQITSSDQASASAVSRPP